MPTQIHFGTSGWRAIVADEFTLENIRRAVAGIAKYVTKQPGPHRVLVGRDPRFLGESFVAEAARVLAGGGRDADRDSGSRADAGDCLCGAAAEDFAGRSTLPPRTIRRSTTASSFRRPTARRRCRK